MSYIEIENQQIGGEKATYIIAEMSANHNQDFKQAVKIIEAAKEAGADAVKLQTYTPDTITLKSDNKYFRIKGTLWEGKYLYDLYKEAYTPWEWQPELKQFADKLNIHLFSSPFDSTAVDFLEKMNVPAYKIASPEIIDIPLITKVAKTEKPVIISTGMANLAEIEEAVTTFRISGGKYLALLKCTSAYPAKYEEMNLKTIPHMQETFGVPVGLSDHTLGIEVAVAAVAFGACIIEKHMTLSRSDFGPDSAFSLEPKEFRSMVSAVRNTEKAMGQISYEITDKQLDSKKYRRSLFVVENIKAGELFSKKNVRSIRPADGLHSRYYWNVIGKISKCNIKSGTPLTWELIE
jgi:pseudaminic acid synthase